MASFHFHNGPWRGLAVDISFYPDDIDEIHVPEDYSGHYEEDPDSAGGRCWDWVEEV